MPYRIPGPQGENPLKTPAQTCGPLGTNQDSGDPGGPGQKGPTPGSVGRNDEGSPGRLPPRLTVKPIVFDAVRVIPFLRSVAYAFVLQRHTRLEWKEDDSAVLGAIYTVFFWKGAPGTAEVNTGDEAKIAEGTRAETARLIATFIQQCAKGPEAAAKWLLDMEQLRADAIGSIRDVLADARQINREAARETGQLIARLAFTRAAATITVGVLGEVLPGAGRWISLGYSVATETIDGVGQASQANAVAVSFQGAAFKEGSAEVAGAVAEWAVDKVNGRPTGEEFQQMRARMDQLDAKLRDQIMRRSQRLAEQSRGLGPDHTQSINSLSSQITRNEHRLNQAQKGVAKSATKAAAAKGVSWAFLGYDIYKALEEYELTRSQALAD